MAGFLGRKKGLEGMRQRRLLIPAPESDTVTTTKSRVARCDGESPVSARRFSRARFSTLTPREREVMALVAAGRLNKQIAWLINS